MRIESANGSLHPRRPWRGWFRCGDLIHTSRRCWHSQKLPAKKWKFSEPKRWIYTSIDLVDNSGAQGQAPGEMVAPRIGTRLGARERRGIVPDGFGVLLIGESARSFTHITRRLEQHGCRCRFVDSYEQARVIILNEPFDLILSVIPPRENAISSLAEMLLGTGASIYYAQLVEDGCWWLPALRRGERCFGAPALRPSEFAALLDGEVARNRADAESEPKPPVAPVISMVTAPSVSAEEIEAWELRVRARSKAAR